MMYQIFVVVVGVGVGVGGVLVLRPQPTLWLLWQLDCVWLVS